MVRWRKFRCVAMRRVQVFPQQPSRKLGVAAKTSMILEAQGGSNNTTSLVSSHRLGCTFP